jgi:hypothetical protein
MYRPHSVQASLEPLVLWGLRHASPDKSSMRRRRWQRQLRDWWRWWRTRRNRRRRPRCACRFGKCLKAWYVLCIITLIFLLNLWASKWTQFSLQSLKLFSDICGTFLCTVSWTSVLNSDSRVIQNYLCENSYTNFILLNVKVFCQFYFLIHFNEK